MLIDTLKMKMKERLTADFDFSDLHAKGIVEAVSSANEEVATKKDLKDGLNDLRRDLTIKIYAVGVVVIGVVISLDLLG